MSNRHSLRSAVRCALLASAAAATSVGPASAQEDAGVEEIIVTGSRIPRANLTAPTSVTTIDAEAIQASGLTNVADILRTVPSFGVAALSTANSNFFTTSAGINTLELRNLEEDRTLVLVNGRRYVSGVPGTSAVDFNTIPAELIDRVEIITGGASAIYGSDALAGVINVILRKDFEGVEFGYQFGEATEGGAIQHRASFTAGGDFAEGRGNAVFSFTFTEDKGLLSRERSNTEVDDIALCRLTGEVSDCQTEEVPFFSSFSEHGRFFVPSTQESFSIAEGTGPNAVVAPWSTTQFGFNRQAFRRYTTPTDRYLLSGLMDYDIGGGINAFAELTFAQTRAESELEPFPHSNSDLNIGGISVDNPFVPAAIRDAVVAAGDDEIQYFRRMTEVGQRGFEATRDTFRFVVGFQGDIADRFTWETYYAFGRTDDAQQGGGQIQVLNMRNALDAIDGDGDPGTFDPICASAEARAEGCVPINLFGLGSISADAADYVRAPTSRQQSAQQEIAGATIGGPVVDLWAGSLDMAFGAEWRRERASDVPDVLTQAGLNAGNAEAPTRGSYDVGEAFVEFELPLVRDVPFVNELSIGGAYRYSDYSTVGNTDAYTGRISWAPIESVRFRGQYARAVRAPNITELFAPGGENFAPVSDPCNNVTATTPGQIAENCRSIPEIAARIAATGVFELTQTEIQGTGGFTGRGNQNLDTETSDSFSFGVIFDQDLGRVGDLTLSIDYFQIEIEDLIDTVDRQTSVDFCYDQPTSAFPNDFCAFVVRDPTGAALQLGEITEVNSGYINEGTLETEGVDVSLLWSWGVPGLQASEGLLSLRANYTHLLDFTETKFNSEDDLTGETGYAENKAQTALLYSSGPWMFQWEWVFIDDVVPDKSNPLFNFNVGSYSTHDFQIGYTFDWDFMEGTRLYAGVNNAFEEDAPIILSGIPGNTTGTDTDASVYNPIGRTWYAGLNVQF